MSTALKLDRMSVPRMVERSLEYGAPISPRNPPSAIVTHLQEVLRVRYSEEVMECSHCGFQSPDTIDLPTCPGCGVAFGADLKDHSEGVPMQQAKAEVVDISAQRTTKPVRQPKATDKAAQQQEDHEARDAAIRGAEAKAQKQLEGLTKKIEKELATQAGSAWRIGKHLAEVYNNDLWKVDVGEDYKSFADFAQRRFQFGKDTARGYLRIAETFGEKEASQMSVSRLWWLARVEDAEERAKLVAQVKSGELRTVRDLIDAVKVKRAEVGLQTERHGFEGTVALSGRFKAGMVVAEGEFKPLSGKTKTLVFAFGLGGQSFRIEANEDDFGVKLIHMEGSEES